MTLEKKQFSICEVAVRIKRAVVEIQDVYRLAIDYESDPVTMKLWNVQNYLIASLEELCRSVRVNLKDYHFDEAIEWEPGIRAATLSRECDEAINELRPSRLRRLLETQAAVQANLPQPEGKTGRSSGAK
jgi:hypothetical protein